MRVLGERLDVATGQLMAEMIGIHHLFGDSAERIEQRVQDFQFSGSLALDEKSGAVAGAVISGMLGGLAADALAGGLTLGGGMIAGGLLGALGGAGLAKGYRLVGGRRRPSVRWSAAFLDQLVQQTLLRYLTVAHFGRGRGQFRDVERPTHWRERVESAVSRCAQPLEAAWARADGGADTELLERDLTEIVEQAARNVFADAYPSLDRR